MSPAPLVTVRIDLPDGARLGHGKARLLEMIRDHGSISAAGRAMGMSYRRAWLLVEALNTMFRAPLVVTQAGGAGGGRAVLTAEGEAALRLYRAVEHEARQAAALAELTALLRD